MARRRFGRAAAVCEQLLRADSEERESVMRTGIPIHWRSALLFGALALAMSASLAAAAQEQAEVLPAACPSAAAETQDENISIVEPPPLALDAEGVELSPVGGPVPVCRTEFCIVPGTRCTFTGLLTLRGKKQCCNYICVSDPTCTNGNGTAPPNSCPVAIPPEE